MQNEMTSFAENLYVQKYKNTDGNLKETFGRYAL